MIDWQTIVAVALAIVVGYIYPKLRIANKTIYLTQKQKEKVKELIDEINKAIEDGKITPDETKEILSSIKAIFETNESDEIEEIVNMVIGILRRK